MSKEQFSMMNDQKKLGDQDIEWMNQRILMG